ncbi:MAG: RNB domain-containing ribonuclease [Cyanobacteria bacterium K_DeepCast_35m_m2_023]|nr:RNB domain-containing ribonuclease [Cyanobacteria bacterium K_DeepCast_35m_m2_023]
MKFTVADLLDQLPDSEPLPLTKLEKALSLSQKLEKEQLRIGLEALTRLGLVEQFDSGVQRRQNDELIAARLRCSSKGFCFALREDGGEDIYIRDHQLNHAWNGDRVLVRITREGGRRRSPEGGVQCILQRQTTSLLAQLEQQGEKVLAQPLDDRLLTSIELPTDDSQHLHDGEQAVVEVLIDRYPVAQHTASGHVARVLPIHGGEAADLDLLLTKHRLHNRPAAPRVNPRATSDSGRNDLTNLPTVLLEAWSGNDAPPLVALSLELREDNGWRLWVHAPSVAERVAPGSSTDQWLRQQGHALCLGDQWQPLLSPALSKACAFKSGESQDALSVCLELDAQGALEHYSFCRSRIKVGGCAGVAAMEALAERKPKSRTTPAALKGLKEHLTLLEQLVALGTCLRQQRLAAGSIDLDLPLPPLELLGDLRSPAPEGSGDGWMIELPAHHPHAIVRECVVVADRALGRHLAALGLPGLFASNPSASSADLHEVVKAALALDIPLELSEDGDPSAADLAQRFARTDRQRPLQQQLRATLQPVVLKPDAAPHALAGESTAVAPWCSATLHYADIWNQQLLLTLLLEGKNRPSVRHKTCVDLASDRCHGAIDWPILTAGVLLPYSDDLAHGLADKLNQRERELREFSADLVAMAQARQAEPLVGQPLQGVISGVQSYGFFVEVPPSQVEGLVHVSSLKDDWYEYRSRQNRLVGRKNRRTYMLGDSVEVIIEKVDPLRHQVDLAVVLPEGDEHCEDQHDPAIGTATDPADDTGTEP